MTQTVIHRTLAENLLAECDTETEVTKFIHENITQSEDTEWVPLGGEPNNYGIVENQQAESMAALTELITNSIDAVLLKNYHQRFGKEHPGNEFQSLKGAAKELVDDSKDRIKLTATGKQGGPLSLTLFDNGTGQNRERFESTFLNVLTPGEIKQDYDFLQGKYGMGSTGVLPFCGKRGYKLIISAAYDEPEKWSWSLVRKNRDRGRYEYLIFGDAVPEFDGEFAGKQSGTFVKCFEYQLRKQSHITKRPRRELERFIVESPLTIDLRDDRYDTWTDASTRGLLPRFEDYREYIHDVEHIEHTFDNDILGTRTISIYLLKADDQLEKEDISTGPKNNFIVNRLHRRHAVLFTVNGQMHGDQGSTFLRRRCGLSRVGKEAIVVVDFSDISDADVVDLFKPSRDRLQNKPPAEILKEELEEVISENEMLKNEEQRRRNRLAKEENEELESDLLEEILEKNPSLKGYLRAGEKQPVVEPGGETEIEYNGNFYPNKFEIIKNYNSRTSYTVWDDDTRFLKEIPVNKSSTQRFELNAENDFFNRETEIGDLEASIPAVIKSVQLKNGILSVTFQPPDGAESENILPVKLTIKPADTGNGELQQTLSLEFTDPVDNSESTTTTPPDPTGSEGFELPKSNWVEEEEWEDHGMDEQSIVTLDPGDEMLLWINKDAAPLRNFMVRHNVKESAKPRVQEIYRLATVFYSVGQYMELKQAYSDDKQWDEIDLAEVVSRTMQGVAQSLLEQTIADDQLDSFTV